MGRRSPTVCELPTTRRRAGSPRAEHASACCQPSSSAVGGTRRRPTVAPSDRRTFGVELWTFGPSAFWCVDLWNHLLFLCGLPACLPCLAPDAGTTPREHAGEARRGVPCEHTGKHTAALKKGGQVPQQSALR